MNFDIKKLFHPAFLLCLITVAIASPGMNYFIEKTNPFWIKHALPLKQSFDLLNEESLLPYEITHKSKIKNKDILGALGTDEYIQWELMDTRESAGSPVRYCSLFITYYTGNPDQVPPRGSHQTLHTSIVCVMKTFDIESAAYVEATKYPRRGGPPVQDEF